LNDTTTDKHIVLQTERLVLRRFTLDDTAFILRQLNEPSWIRFIADSGVRTPEAARDYLLTRPLAMYERHGFGLWLAELKADGTPIGMCGLIRRDGLPDVDIGYALLPEYWGQGYAQEAAAATLDYGRRVLDLKRIVAITSVDNDSSVRVLERIGLKFERIMPFGDDQHDVRLFATP
jgi:RimJ/RimL family protein N-acetyltransferase